MTGCVYQLLTGLFGQEVQRLSTLRKQVLDSVDLDEGLSPCSQADARRVFRDDAAVKDYMSFNGNTRGGREARTYWLAGELKRVQQSR